MGERNTSEGVSFFRKLSRGKDRSISFPTGTAAYSIKEHDNSAKKTKWYSNIPSISGGGEARGERNTLEDLRRCFNFPKIVQFF